MPSKLKKYIYKKILGDSRVRNSDEQTLALLLHSKVDDGCLCGNFWSVVGVTQFSCDVKLEVRVVLNFLVTESNHVPTTCIKLKADQMFSINL